MRFADLRIRLRGFIEPDTSSQFEGHLEIGRYRILEYRTFFPDGDSDYARIEAPGLGANDTWICTRWKQQVYADVAEVAPPVTTPEVPSAEPFDAVDGAVQESAILAHLPIFHSFTYDLDDARYPEPLPNVALPLAPPNTNNCCTFVEALLVKTWADEVDGFEWSAARHKQMMIMSADDYFSPVTALIEANMAVPDSDPDAPPKPWTVIQGWRRRWTSGHTFIVVDHDQETDRVLTLESNSAYKLDGVGFRKIGNLRDFGGAPPDRWWQRDDLWTWQQICSTYRYRRKAALKVSGISWSKRATAQRTGAGLADAIVNAAEMAAGVGQRLESDMARGFGVDPVLAAQFDEAGLREIAAALRPTLVRPSKFEVELALRLEDRRELSASAGVGLVALPSVFAYERRFGTERSRAVSLGIVVEQQRNQSDTGSLPT